MLIFKPITYKTFGPLISRKQ